MLKQLSAFVKYQHLGPLNCHELIESEVLSYVLPHLYLCERYPEWSVGEPAFFNPLCDLTVLLSQGHGRQPGYSDMS